MLTGILILAVVTLAYANGANDNMKGVATLLGSRTTTYAGALWWATGTTLAGSLVALGLAHQLVAAFRGKGLVPAAATADPAFLAAVGLGAAGTVLLATGTGFPISTTHALVGGLVGAGLVTAGGAVALERLGTAFVLPLLVSPGLALALTAGLYPLLRGARRRLGVTRETCLCLGETGAVRVLGSGEAAAMQAGTLALTVDAEGACFERYRGQVLGVNSQTALNALHVLSAGAVSFARGVNDTPKIMALLAGASLLAPRHALLLTGLVIAAGGLLSARRVARTLSERITPMNHGQGFTANLVTAFLVIVASGWGLPVSTTHVSCGSLFGLGLATREGRWPMIRNILLAWGVTLPTAAALAALAAWALAGGA